MPLALPAGMKTFTICLLTNGIIGTHIYMCVAMQLSMLQHYYRVSSLVVPPATILSPPPMSIVIDGISASEDMGADMGSDMRLDVILARGLALGLTWFLTVLLKL